MRFSSRAARADHSLNCRMQDGEQDGEERDHHRHSLRVMAIIIPGKESFGSMVNGQHIAMDPQIQKKTGSGGGNVASAKKSSDLTK